MLGALTTSGFNLQWSAPATCPEEAEVNARIVGYLGGATPVNTGNANASAEVTMVGAQFRVLIHSNLGAAPGERILAGETCDAVADAVALILAMMIDPDAVRGAPSEPAPITAPAAVAVAVPLPLPSNNPSHLSIEAGVVSGIGVLPELAFGVRLGLGVSTGNWTASVAAQFWSESTRHVPLDHTVGGRFSRTSLGIRVTRNWLLWRTLSGRVGLGTDGVRTTARGFGVSDPGEASSIGLEPLVTTGLQWEVAHWVALQSEILAGLPLYRPQFTLIDRGQVWRPAVAQITWGFSAVLRF